MAAALAVFGTGIPQSNVVREMETSLRGLAWEEEEEEEEEEVEEDR